ncbi:MAG: uroporphyrinogen decarboxylase family protein [Clostridiales bacterium]|jgi:hypothetical protein|nr:hypothetical protein [Eubacteriales bacterium]MDH7567417.1 uroporphyrinogen decarboxylase family protein [Clostridiales bacterium]
MDTLTPMERLAAYNKGQAVDRLPCVPIIGNTAARIIGARVSEFRGNGALLAKAHIASYRLFKYDIIRIFTDLYTQAEAMGQRSIIPRMRPLFFQVRQSGMFRKLTAFPLKHLLKTSGQCLIPSGKWGTPPTRRSCTAFCKNRIHGAIERLLAGIRHSGQGIGTDPEAYKRRN